MTAYQFVICALLASIALLLLYDIRRLGTMEKERTEREFTQASHVHLTEGDDGARTDPVREGDGT